MTTTPLTELGDFIRTQREVARMSVRRLAETAGVSNPYLSQIERGLRKRWKRIAGESRPCKRREAASQTVATRGGVKSHELLGHQHPKNVQTGAGNDCKLVCDGLDTERFGTAPEHAEDCHRATDRRHGSHPIDHRCRSRPSPPWRRCFTRSSQSTFFVHIQILTPIDKSLAITP